MDREIEEGNLATAERRKKPYSSGHLMCRTSLSGLAGFVGCAYFTWISFAHVLHNEYEWPHDYWTAATYLVWIILLGALTFDTRCLREQVFFGVLVINFLAGCGLRCGAAFPLRTCAWRALELACSGHWPRC